MKHKIPNILIIVGLVLILGSLSMKFYSQSKESKAVENFEQKKSENLVIKEIKPGDEIALIEIPAVNLNTVIVHGTENKYLKYYACHFEYSAMPGENGNFALAGHSSYIYNQVFNNVRKLKLGDVINIKTVDDEFTYTITEMFETHPSNIDVLDQDMDKKEMTIVTCTNGGEDRLIVKAEIK